MNELGALVASHIPALVMLIVGYALLVVEMYVPGFGLPGISGIVLLTVGMIAMEPSPLQALVLVLIRAVMGMAGIVREQQSGPETVTHALGVPFRVSGRLITLSDPRWVRVPEELLADAQEARDGCPVSAISLE